jgi:hypothetical protein
MCVNTVEAVIVSTKGKMLFATTVKIIPLPAANACRLSFEGGKRVRSIGTSLNLGAQWFNAFFRSNVRIAFFRDKRFVKFTVCDGTVTCEALTEAPLG